jgi:dihydrolipoamide dehydrogenase
MKKENTHDLIVIGGGPGGHATAEYAARNGAKVCIIEKSDWGGTCTHRGCIPTKALLASSKRFADLKKLKRMGISISDSSFDFDVVKRHQLQMVRLSAMGTEISLREAGVELKLGEGVLSAPGTVEYRSAAEDIQILTAPHITIAWGSEPSILPFLEIGEKILTSDEFLNLKKLPKRVIIIGGNVIGVEFATFLAEMGSAVTLVEILDRIIPYEDEEAADLMEQDLKRLGVLIHTATTVKAAEDIPDGIRVLAEKGTNPLTLEGDCILLCAGRKPRLYPEQLAALDIAYDSRGIRVNKHLHTNIEGVYAVGDVTGGMMLAHRAIQQGRALASRLFGDGSVPYLEEAVPSVVYSHPPLARVGLTSSEARKRGMDIEVIKTDYSANIMARTELAGQGFVKFLFHQGRLVGATIFGAEASELIVSLSLAVAGQLERRTLSSWIIPHPTISEILRI